MMLRFRRERGAAAVETSLVFGLLVLIAIGAAEWGFGLRDWLSVTAGAREGARVAAAAGDTAGADCVVLEATAGAVRNINGAVMEVWIYESDTSGSVGAAQKYRPALPTEPSITCPGWFTIESSWPESVRDNDGSVRDWLGVRVTFDHDWLTGFAWFSGSVCERGLSGNCWAADTVMHIEPDPNP